MKKITSLTLNLIILSTLFIVTSCGKEYNQINGILEDAKNHNKKIVNVQSELRPYFDSFMKKSLCFKKRPHFNNLTIKMTESLPLNKNGGQIIGKCKRPGSMYTDTSPQTILILESYWINATIQEREKLVYHELTHCTLDGDHSDDPNSVMYENATTFSDADYETYYDKAMKDMFDQRSACFFEFDATLYPN